MGSVFNVLFGMVHGSSVPPWSAVIHGHGRNWAMTHITKPQALPNRNAATRVTDLGIKHARRAPAMAAGSRRSRMIWGGGVNH